LRAYLHSPFLDNNNNNNNENPNKNIEDKNKNNENENENSIEKAAVDMHSQTSYPTKQYNACDNAASPALHIYLPTNTESEEHTIL
jgi:hypothetical protein